MNPLLVNEKLAGFLKEDIGFGDLSVSYLPTDKVLTGYFIAKQSGIVCGQQLPQLAYNLIGEAHYTSLVSDGQHISSGQKIGKVVGAAATLLTGERVILNLMQRMSGIATKTAQVITELNDPTIKITDTRKTTPGLRLFDKYAVTVGGGFNHRFDLTNAIMLKDNHIALAGGVKEALLMAQKNAGPLTPIEIEVETKQELQDAISIGADVIMFDNQDPSTIKKWKKLVPDNIHVEASGGISEDTIASFSGCGADFISIGNLTNAVSPLDISFLVEGTVKKSVHVS
ncbi:carboxylating nicotinate-nucleotide diphosphorylase [Lentilactobacillus hilgardii]|uniref:carboxylating nicotinate-nucleotide diphosphorylase n=1 Tax=Lentilactobacillus hilgardii TaxID=1588 RepID=UPI0021C4A531|nr:carboxylating nicotinate-nucleotide diphosphorylase [Lentilactobacillus hilgardii]MCP9332666.1 carboxylating nicotinate-nucleotide diphosphorylase [Lentilactobacillus hilgardii]MCP9349270.1 carboxylating nicotinate-nucleotide diphosphorylase [Lentilactobacillus hilgardii]MCP9352139.1 carboxylating nicotinate-nucleotide diphosphorylase [Lentilactobacillus hilgardii]